jgi:uncharacterized protein YoxC
MYAATRRKIVVMPPPALMYIAMLVVVAVVFSMLLVQTSHSVDQAPRGVSAVLEALTSEQVGQSLR